MSAVVALVVLGFFGLLAFFSLFLLGCGVAFFWWRQKTSKVFDDIKDHNDPQHYLVPLTPFQQSLQVPQIQPISSHDEEKRELIRDLVYSFVRCRLANICNVSVESVRVPDGYQIWECRCGRVNLKKSPNECIQCAGCMNFNIGIAPVDDGKRDRPAYRPEEHAEVAPVPDCASSSSCMPPLSDNKRKDKEDKKDM